MTYEESNEGSARHKEKDHGKEHTHIIIITVMYVHWVGPLRRKAHNKTITHQ